MNLGKETKFNKCFTCSNVHGKAYTWIHIANLKCQN